jgi:hypothetical protein
VGVDEEFMVTNGDVDLFQVNLFESCQYMVRCSSAIMNLDPTSVDRVVIVSRWKRDVWDVAVIFGVIMILLV